MPDIASLQRYLRSVVASSKTVVTVPSFTVYVDTADAFPFSNYAIPDDGAQPDGPAVEQLLKVFATATRRPRLEWLEEMAPAAAPVLAAAGLVEELRAPAMALAPGEDVDATVDLEALAIGVVEDGEVRDFVNVQRRAFGEDDLAEGVAASDPRRRGGGGIVARVDGVVVSAAQWLPIIDGVTEIVGVATEERWRGRGLAGAVTAAAAREAFRGDARHCLLSPGSETAQRVYERAGFHRVATMVHMIAPA